MKQRRLHINIFMVSISINELVLCLLCSWTMIWPNLLEKFNKITASTKFDTILEIQIIHAIHPFSKIYIEFQRGWNKIRSDMGELFWAQWASILNFNERLMLILLDGGDLAIFCWIEVKHLQKSMSRLIQIFFYWVNLVEYFSLESKQLEKSKWRSTQINIFPLSSV